MIDSPDRQSRKLPRNHWHRAAAVVLIASRHEAKLTQEHLALRLGWQRTRIAGIESGKRRIDVPEFICIANGLNIDPPQLLARVLQWNSATAVYRRDNHATE